MKRAGKIKYVLTAMMLMLLLSVPGCISEDCPECYEAETGTLVLSLKSRGVSPRAGDLFTGDDVISRVRIIVFTGAAVEHNQLYESGQDAFDNPITVVLATGQKSLYVVANEADALSAALDGVGSAAELTSLMANEISSALTPPLLMVGSEDDLDLVAGVNNETITLTRAAAKINIQLKKGVDEPVTISRISLLSNTIKTTLWEDVGVTFTQGYWDYNGGVSLTLSKTEWSSAHTVYVYENLGNSSTSKTNATQLEIEGTFNGLPATYRVYVNENVDDDNPTPGNPGSSETNPDDHFYNIKRNHVYNITGTISGLGQFDGITIYTDVEEWEGVEKDYFVGYGYTVEVDGKEVTVSNHDKDCPPHEITLKTLGSFTFSDNSTEQTFEETAAGVTAEFSLNKEPEAEDGDYLEVYYNGVLVNTFTK